MNLRQEDILKGSLATAQVARVGPQGLTLLTTAICSIFLSLFVLVGFINIWNKEDSREDCQINYRHY